MDQHVPTSKVSTWITNRKFTLLREDQHILLHPAGWMTASIIAAAQSMLKDQHRGIGGLQDPSLAQSMRFRIESGKFVQVMHNGFGHWLTVTNIGADSDSEVMVYDSLYPSIGTFVQKQIATLLRTGEKKIKVNIMNMQMQSGTCDFGLFAIATATSLLNGTYPETVTYKQPEMRRHLYDSICEGRLEPFPVLKLRRSKRRIKYSETFPVYCICRLIETSDRDMVACSSCQEWFHVDCLEEVVPKDALENTKVDCFCSLCVK